MTTTTAVRPAAEPATRRTTMLDDYLWQFVTSTGKRQGTIEVSPDTAKRILGMAGPQRRVIKGQVARYAEWMRDGRWIDNAGGDLLFDVNGDSRGGQHRLLAQVEAGISVSYKIRWDQTEEEIAADGEGGTPWTAVDIAGGDAPHAKTRQAAATMLLAIDASAGEIGGQTHWLPGRLDVARRVNDPRVIRAAEIGSRVNTSTGINMTAVAVMYAITAASGRGDAPSFFEQLRTGAGLTLGDPALTLRNVLLGVNFRNTSQRKWQTAYVTARAWNYHVNGERTTRLQRFSPPTTNPVRPLGWKPFFESK